MRRRYQRRKKYHLRFKHSTRGWDIITNYGNMSESILGLMVAVLCMVMGISIGVGASTRHAPVNGPRCISISEEVIRIA